MIISIKPVNTINCDILYMLIGDNNIVSFSDGSTRQTFMNNIHKYEILLSTGLYVECTFEIYEYLNNIHNLKIESTNKLKCCSIKELTNNDFYS